MAELAYLSKYSSLNVAAKWHDRYDSINPYCQKFLQGDIIRLQGIRTNNITSNAFPTFNLINVNDSTTTPLLPTYYEGKDGEQIFDFLIQDSDNQLTPGMYEVSVYDSVSMSEIYNIPFRVYELGDQELDGTILLRYTNDINDFDTNFLTPDGQSLLFDFRIEGDRNYPADILNNQSDYFRNQDYYQRQLSSVPYIQESLIFGSTEGCPAWAGEKINMIFSLKHVEVTNDNEIVRYERSEGATIEVIEKSPDYPLYNFTILVERIEMRYSQYFSNSFENNFIGAFRATLNVSANTIIRLPITDDGEHWVDWGDGTVGLYQGAYPSHTYTTSGNYQIAIANDFYWQSENNGAIQTAFVSVDLWGSGKFFKNGNYAFQNYTSLASLAVDTQNVILNNIDGMFSGCSALFSIPNDLFRYSTSITSVDRTFERCTALTTISDNLFTYNTSITSFNTTFYLSGISAIPTNLFSTNRLVTLFYSTFNSCNNLTIIPANLFVNNVNVDSFYGVFANCVNLSAIPGNLFDTNVNATNMSYIFQNCTSLTTVPIGLFNENINVITFQNLFFGCRNLATIPAGLFDNNIDVEIFQNTFYNCTSLETIPDNLFINNTSVTNFLSCFYSCTSLTSRSPLDTNNTDLWERGIENLDYVLPTQHNYCFTNCFLMENFALIPEDWGGLGLSGDIILTNASGSDFANTGESKIIRATAGIYPVTLSVSEGTLDKTTIDSESDSVLWTIGANPNNAVKSLIITANNSVGGNALAINQNAGYLSAAAPNTIPGDGATTALLAYTSYTQIDSATSSNSEFTIVSITGDEMPYNVNVSATPNTTGQRRQSLITINAGQMTTEIYIIQQPASFSVSPDSVILNPYPNGNTGPEPRRFQVISEPTNWTASIVGSATWLRLLETSGVSGGYCRFETEANTGEQRIGTIRFTNGIQTVDRIVTQYAGVLSVTVQDSGTGVLSISNAAQNLIYNITCNWGGTWGATLSNANLGSLSTPSGTGTVSGLIWQVPANTTTAERSSHIFVACDGITARSRTVTQEQRDLDGTLNITDGETIPIGGGRITLEWSTVYAIGSNGGIGQITSSDVRIATVTLPTGQTSGSVTVSVGPRQGTQTSILFSLVQNNQTLAQVYARYEISDI